VATPVSRKIEDSAWNILQNNKELFGTLHNVCLPQTSCHLGLLLVKKRCIPNNNETLDCVWS